VDPEVTFTTVTTEEEPLRAQLSRRAEQLYKTSPLARGKIRIENEEENLATEGSYMKSKPQRDRSLNKRKLEKEKENEEDFSLEKFTRKSQRLAENLKKLIGEEIDNFSRECDSLRSKLQNMLEDKQTVTSPNSKSYLAASYRNNTDEMSESKLNQISQKIERLMDDVGERKVGMSSSMKVDPSSNFGFNSSSFKGVRGGITEKDLKN